MDKFSKFGWTVPLKNKNAQTIKDSFEKNRLGSKRPPNLVETDRRKEFPSGVFADFLNKNNFEGYSRSNFLGDVFAECFNHTIRNLRKRPVFERGDGNWIDISLVITKQYNNKIPCAIKITPIQGSEQKKEGFVYKKLLDKGKKLTPNFQVPDLFRTADLKKTFPKRNTTNWSYKLF